MPAVRCCGCAVGWRIFGHATGSGLCASTARAHPCGFLFSCFVVPVFDTWVMDENVGRRWICCCPVGMRWMWWWLRRGSRRGLMPGSCRLCTCWAVSSRRFWMTPGG